jgi:hypothetical protein
VKDKLDSPSLLTATVELPGVRGSRDFTLDIGNGTSFTVCIYIKENVFKNFLNILILIHAGMAKKLELCISTHFSIIVTQCQDRCLFPGEDRVVVEARRANYLLDIFLPHSICQESVSAAFHIPSATLHIRLPLSDS